MLDVTRASTFAPGTNIKGDVRGANWALLLNRLELGRILFLGAPTQATLSMLATLSEQIMVWEPNPGRRQRLQAWLERRQMPVVAVAERPQAAWQLDELRLDLLCHTPGHPWPTSLLRDALHAGTQVYVETHASFHPHAWARELDQILGQIRGPLRVALTPLQGEIRSAVPLNDRETARYFLRNAMCGTNARLPGLKLAERALARNGIELPLTRRLGLLHRGKPRDATTGGVGLARAQHTVPTQTNLGSLAGDIQAPLYLRELALRNGLTFDDSRWGLWARGEYRSQKAIFFVFDRKTGEPQHVVKMVRDPEFNGRLENEHHALQRLHQLGPEHREHVPQSVFLGHPGRLAAVGETMMEGAPFSSKTNRTAECPAVREAVHWLTSLAESSARAATPGMVATAVQDVFERFCNVYQPPPHLRIFLERQIEVLARSNAPIPVVFQHGDPGVWNVVVQPHGRVVFMDWEAAETNGIPLWDLFYFLRSYVLLSRVRGLRTRAETFASHFLEDGSLSGLIQHAVSTYCARVGLSVSLVEPLFFTCWMHRALKESNRLSPDRLEHGRFIELLQLSIAQRKAPGLQRLFGDAQRHAA